MTWIPRHLDIEHLLARRSVFLFGPRQTGKTTYVRRQLDHTVELTFSLLDRGSSPRFSPTRRASEGRSRLVICATR